MMNCTKVLCLLAIILVSGVHIVHAQETRTYDGRFNNPLHSDWGARGATLERMVEPAYGDGYSTPAGQDRPNPREISNSLFSQTESHGEKANLSDFVWVFGQFIDHDLTLIHNNSSEPAYIDVPECDPWFDPDCDGIAKIPMFRAKAVEGTGTAPANPRAYANDVSSFLDGSAVYGSSRERADWLRSFEDGKLKVSPGNMMPFNTTDGTFNAPRDFDAPMMGNENPFTQKLFVGGDIRVNENISLTAMHTLFVREHNRLCDELKEENPAWNDERLFQEARRRVGAIIQSILYGEWLPTLGVELSAYNGFKPDVNPSVRVLFSAAAYRMGHTLLSSRLIRMDQRCNAIDQGHTTLKEAFFNPQAFIEAGGIEPLIKGMSAQIMQELDCKVIDDVRNFLFGPPGAGLGMDLVSINIHRGREMGLPDYNTIRRSFGLPPAQTFIDICSDEEVAGILEDLYGDVEKVDPWVGFLAEDHMPNALFGESIMRIMKMQFTALRDGDRFYYENDPAFTTEEIEEIRSTRLVDVIKRNTDIKFMQENVFIAEPECEFAQLDLDRNGFDMLLYPNPTPDYFNMAIHSISSGLAEMRIYNQLGQLVMENELELDEDINVFRFFLGHRFSPGNYTIRVDMGGGTKALQLIKTSR